MGEELIPLEPEEELPKDDDLYDDHEISEAMDIVAWLLEKLAGDERFQTGEGESVLVHDILTRKTLYLHVANSNEWLAERVRRAAEKLTADRAAALGQMASGDPEAITFTPPPELPPATSGSDE